MPMIIDGPPPLKDVSMPAGDTALTKNGPCDAIVKLKSGGGINLTMDGPGSLWLTGRSSYTGVRVTKNGAGSLVWVPKVDADAEAPTLVENNGPGTIRMGTADEVTDRRQQG